MRCYGTRNCLIFILALLGKNWKSGWSKCSLVTSSTSKLPPFCPFLLSVFLFYPPSFLLFPFLSFFCHLFTPSLSLSFSFLPIYCLFFCCVPFFHFHSLSLHFVLFISFPLSLFHPVPCLFVVPSPFFNVFLFLFPPLFSFAIPRSSFLCYSYFHSISFANTGHISPCLRCRSL